MTPWTPLASAVGEVELFLLTIDPDPPSPPEKEDEVQRSPPAPDGRSDVTTTGTSGGVPLGFEAPGGVRRRRFGSQAGPTGPVTGVGPGSGGFTPT